MITTSTHCCFYRSHFGLSLLFGRINLHAARVTAGGDICVFREICLLDSVVHGQLRITTKWKVMSGVSFNRRGLELSLACCAS